MANFEKSVRRRLAEERFVEQQRSLTGKEAFYWFLKRIILFMVLIAYTVIGAFVFQLLEQSNELEQCKQREYLYNTMEEDVAQKLWNVGQSFYANVDESQLENALSNVKSIVEQYSADVIQFKSDGYDGRNCSLMGTDGGGEYDWSFVGSMLFAITVYTTVGYGNIAPETTWGRVTVIAYAMVGIPIMLMCVAFIGEIMADVFRFVYIHLCCCGLCARRTRRRRRRQREAAEKRQQSNAPSWTQLYQEQISRARGQPTPVVVDDYDDLCEDEEGTVAVPLTVTLLVIFGYIVMGAAMFGVWESWEATEAAYFCFVTISTIGFGDVVPGAASGIVNKGDALKMIIDGIYIVIGLAIISMAFNLIQENMASKVKMLEDKLSGSHGVDDGPETVGHAAAVAAPAAVPMATPYMPPPPMSYVSDKKPSTYQPGPGGGDPEQETSFSRPSTSGSYLGARPKTPKMSDDHDGPADSDASTSMPAIAD